MTPNINDIGVDTDLKHKDWPTKESAARMGQEEGSVSPAISSYGYAVYREFLRLRPDVDPFLDTQVFAPDTDFIEVLQEAIACAVDDENKAASLKLTEKVLEYAANQNFGTDKMQEYLDFALDTRDPGVIALYVRYMNQNVTKGTDEAKDFMKSMAHGVRDIPIVSFQDQDGLDRVVKQVLLEEIGQAWIRKSMPVAEIDWLP